MADNRLQRRSSRASGGTTSRNVMVQELRTIRASLNLFFSYKNSKNVTQSLPRSFDTRVTCGKKKYNCITYSGAAAEDLPNIEGKRLIRSICYFLEEDVVVDISSCASYSASHISFSHTHCYGPLFSLYICHAVPTKV